MNNKIRYPKLIKSLLRDENFNTLSNHLRLKIINSINNAYGFDQAKCAYLVATYKNENIYLYLEFLVDIFCKVEDSSYLIPLLLISTNDLVIKSGQIEEIINLVLSTQDIDEAKHIARLVTKESIILSSDPVQVINKILNKDSTTVLS